MNKTTIEWVKPHPAFTKVLSVMACIFIIIPLWIATSALIGIIILLLYFPTLGWSLKIGEHYIKFLNKIGGDK